MDWARRVALNLAGYRRAWLVPDAIAGITLVAVAIPECMGYTKIVGTPVVTGLYTIFLPIAAFALLGSSRHLVVGADSATAAILFAGLTGMAQPNTEPWLRLASASALLTAAFLVVAAIARLGFLANFLSRTVLVGFLSGVGVTLLVAEIPDILGVPVGGREVVERVTDTIRGAPQTHLPTLAVSVAVLLVILLLKRFAPRLPGALLAVALAIAAAWIFGLDRVGVAVVGSVPPGLPAVRVPDVPLSDLTSLLPTSVSMFLVILAQSAATSRSFAQRHDESLNENRDLAALGVANAVAGLSSTFVVNGSPTKTAVADSAGARTQVAQLVTAGVVLAVLLVATSLIAHLPNAALAALVFLIGADLVDVHALRRLYHLTKGAFVVAVATLLAVMFLGVERGIFLAIGLSILDHLRREYRPRDVLLVHAGGTWKSIKAEPGRESEPGLLIYRFEAELFFANADYFSERIQELVKAAPHPVRWLVLNLVSMDDIDYTGGLMLEGVIARLQRSGVTVAIAQAEGVEETLKRYGILAQVGASHAFETVQEAVEAFRHAVGAGGPPGPERVPA